MFFVDSHQNGATSWIPKTLPANVKVIISLTFNEDESKNKREMSRFVKTFSEGLMQADTNVASVGQLGPILSEKVIRLWLDRCGRTLTNHQASRPNEC